MEFSRRFGRFFPSEGLPPAEPAFLAKQKRLESGQNVLDLTISNPSLVGLEFPAEVLAHSFSGMDLSVYLPDFQGNAQARQAISSYYQETGRTVSWDSLFLTASTSEAYSFLFQIFCNPGDEVLVPKPGYPLFSYLADLSGIQLVEYPEHLSEVKPKINFDSKEKNGDFSGWTGLISSKTKMLVLVSPNNPTGKLYSDSELLAVWEFCQERNLICIVDEVFRDYLREGVSLPTDFSLNAFIQTKPQHPPIFFLNGISKVLALPQMKLSWIQVVANSQNKERVHSALEILTDTFLSVNSPIQMALPDLMVWRKTVQARILNRIHRNWNFARFHLSPSWKFAQPEGGWCMVMEWLGSETKTGFEKIKMQNPNKVYDWELALLEKTGVYLHPGRMYGYSPERVVFVASLLTETEVWDEGILQLATWNL